MPSAYRWLTALLLGGLISFAVAPLSTAITYAQGATPTPAAEEEPAMHTEHAAHDGMDGAAMGEDDVDADAPTTAQLLAQIDALQARVAELEASIRVNQVNNAIYQLDLVGLHALDERLSDTGEIMDSDSSRVGAIARLMATVTWPEELAADATALTALLYELSDSLAAEDLEAGAALAAQAHEEQHALSHAVEHWLAARAAGQDAHGADMAAMNGMDSHAHEDATVIDADGLLIENIRANLSIPSTTGSVWLKLTNTTAVDEALTGAEIPGCGVVELHDMKMENDVMVMFPVEGGEIPIPAGETVELKRGSLHIMCIEKEAPVEVGAMVTMTLHFANAGDVEVTAPVVAPDSGMGDMEGMDHGDGAHEHDAGN